MVLHCLPRPVGALQYYFPKILNTNFQASSLGSTLNASLTSSPKGNDRSPESQHVIIKTKV